MDNLRSLSHGSRLAASRSDLDYPGACSDAGIWSQFMARLQKDTVGPGEDRGSDQDRLDRSGRSRHFGG